MCACVTLVELVREFLSVALRRTAVQAEVLVPLAHEQRLHNVLRTQGIIVSPPEDDAARASERGSSSRQGPPGGQQP